MKDNPYRIDTPNLVIRRITAWDRDAMAQILTDGAAMDASEKSTQDLVDAEAQELVDKPWVKRLRFAAFARGDLQRVLLSVTITQRTKMDKIEGWQITGTTLPAHRHKKRMSQMLAEGLPHIVRDMGLNPLFAQFAETNRTALFLVNRHGFTKQPTTPRMRNAGDVLYRYGT